jgi:hypothetical protein
MKHAPFAKKLTCGESLSSGKVDVKGEIYKRIFLSDPDIFLCDYFSQLISNNLNSAAAVC